MRPAQVGALDEVEMNLLSMFGLFAVTAMLIFYALESRGRIFVLCFAGACAMGSLYGFLQGAWPFGLVEAVWTLVALRRWSQAKGTAQFDPLEAK
jgi:hypothetical protein